jgi:CcmD family protein
MKKLLISILSLSVFFSAHAQNTESLFRSSGKIYVVVGIIAIIFLLIVLYLFRLDRKIGKLEQQKNRTSL